MIYLMIKKYTTLIQKPTMNSQLIEKIIKSNDPNVCLEFNYANPLLDRNVANAVARSFIQILRVSQHKSTINKNLRHSVLANIRKMCRVQPENHLEISDTAISLLTKVYMEEAKASQSNIHTDPIEKQLDDFLIRRLKHTDVNSNYQASLNPEVGQSLINLNESNIEVILPSILSLDFTSKKTLSLVKDLWTRPYLCNSNSLGDISIKMKEDIEKLLLDICSNLLTEQGNMKDLFQLKSLKELVLKCSISAECFQLCCMILNYIFTKVNYSLSIQYLITEFVRNVKELCNSIAVLYPVHLCHVVALLDVDLDMPMEIRDVYIQKTLPYLKQLHSESESDMQLLISHYPDWFDIYFKQ